MRERGRSNLTKATTPMTMAEMPIVISTKAIRVSISFRDRYPQHTPFDSGIQLQNIGSLSYKMKLPSN